MKKTIFEEMGGTYIRHGDYLIPCLALPEDEEQRFIGVWGQRHKRYLKEHKKGYYTFLMINGSVPFELRNIDSAANERVKKIIKQLADEENVNEELKAKDQMEWVRCMNNIKNRAEEIVLKELIYV